MKRLGLGPKVYHLAPINKYPTGWVMDYRVGSFKRVIICAAYDKKHAATLALTHKQAEKALVGIKRCLRKGKRK